VKSDILIEQFQRIGGISNPPVLPAVSSLKSFQYRNHVQFHLSKEGKLGYQKAHSNEVLIIQECHIPDPVLNWIWPKLSFENLSGLNRIGLRVGTQEEVQLILESDDPSPPELSVEEMDISVVHLSKGDSLVLAGSPEVVIEILDRPFHVSAGSFFQVNTSAAEALVEHLIRTIPKYLTLRPDSILIDAYCGVGLFSAFLADSVGKLVGIESSPDSVEDFITN